jgi:hypothetical protein
MSWIDDAKSLAATVVLVREKVDAATADFRGRVCTACGRLDRETLRCKECGCYLKAKVWAKVNRSPARPLGEVTHCPLGKWRDRDIANHYRAIDGKPPLPPPVPRPASVAPAAQSAARSATEAGSGS